MSNSTDNTDLGTGILLGVIIAACIVSSGFVFHGCVSALISETVHEHVQEHHR